MSVMFEVLEHLEKRDADAALGLASRAWSMIVEPPVIEPDCSLPAPAPIAADPAESVSQDLSNLSRVPFRGKRKSSLLDIRFDPEATSAPARKPRRAKAAKEQAPSPETSLEPSTDFPSLWAMARLCKKRSPVSTRSR